MSKITADNITPKQLRGMRIATILLAISNIILLTLYIQTDVQLEQTDDQLLIEKYDSQARIEQLETQVDSLTSQLRESEE